MIWLIGTMLFAAYGSLWVSLLCFLIYLLTELD